MSYFTIGLASYIAATLSTWCMIKLAIMDRPVARSSHSAAIPTAGGVSLAAAALSFVGLGHIFGLELGSFGAVTTIWVLGGVLAAALLGLLDDIFHYGSKGKFLFMLGLSSISIYLLGPVQAFPLGDSGAALPAWLGYLGGALWIFTVMNVVNFMDGANGMLGLNMLIATAAIALFVFISQASHGAAPVTLFWCAVLTAGLLGFSQFNVRFGAKIFAGDVGALSTGYLYSIIVLLAASELPSTGVLYLGPLFILPFLTDVFLTLIRRLKGGHNVLQAHNTHLFQRLISDGRSHIKVSLYYAAAGLICVTFGVLAEVLTLSRSPLFLLMMCALMVGVYSWVYKTKGQV